MIFKLDIRKLHITHTLPAVKLVRLMDLRNILLPLFYAIPTTNLEDAGEYRARLHGCVPYRHI